MPAASHEERIVALPGGLVLADGRRLATAALQPLTGFEEEWLAANPGAPSASAVTRLLSSCLVRLGDVTPTFDLVRGLLVGDRDYLMLQLRGLTMGETIAAVVDCPSCEAKMDLDFAIESVPVERRAQDSATFEIQCPGRSLRFRLPNGGDQEAVLGLDQEEAVAALLDRCLAGNDGAKPSAAERDEVIEAMDRLAPKIELELELTCPECGGEWLSPFDTTAFVLHEFRIAGRQLLREVHALASTYHWRERDILGLRRDRRRAYLALLSDTI